MHFKTTTVLLATAAVSGVTAQNRTTGDRGDAIVVENNPPGVVYLATLPETAFTKGSAYPDGGNVEGSILATASPDGVGVIFKVRFANLPKEGGPFKYHLHSAPASDGFNCTTTLSHLDPFIRGENPGCNSSTPEKCEVGDLSGKWGEVKTDPFEATYTDKYASTLEGLGAFFGNRSFVFHYANKTRISCANFKKVEGTGSGGGSPSEICSTSTSAPTATTSKGSAGTGVITMPRPTQSFVTVSSAALAGLSGVAGAAALFAAAAFLL